jgi:hypothetical protein
MTYRHCQSPAPYLHPFGRPAATKPQNRADRVDEEVEMPYLDHSAQVLLVLFLPGIILGLFATWTSYRTRSRGMDALKAYAERGEEPPASLLEAIRPSATPQPRRQSRGEALSHGAFSVVMAAGSAGLAWWWSQSGAGGLAPLAVVTAVVFAAISLSMLVAALSATRPGREAKS